MSLKSIARSVGIRLIGRPDDRDLLISHLEQTLVDANATIARERILNKELLELIRGKQVPEERMNQEDFNQLKPVPRGVRTLSQAKARASEILEERRKANEKAG